MKQKLYPLVNYEGEMEEIRTDGDTIFRRPKREKLPKDPLDYWDGGRLTIVEEKFRREVFGFANKFRKVEFEAYFPYHWSSQQALNYFKEHPIALTYGRVMI